MINFKTTFLLEEHENNIKDLVKHRKKCQLNKLLKEKYGKLLVKNNALYMKPWKQIYVDTNGPWEILINKYKKEK